MEGPYSGEEFRKSLLLPAYHTALSTNEELTIDLDGCYGLATSFLEEAFGGLVREVKNKKILDILVLVTEDRPGLIEKVIYYINNADA
jgi:hypothetical protein